MQCFRLNFNKKNLKNWPWDIVLLSLDIVTVVVCLRHASCYVTVCVRMAGSNSSRVQTRRLSTQRVDKKRRLSICKRRTCYQSTLGWWSGIDHWPQSSRSVSVFQTTKPWCDHGYIGPLDGAERIIVCSSSTVQHRCCLFSTSVSTSILHFHTKDLSHFVCGDINTTVSACWSWWTLFVALSYMLERDLRVVSIIT